MHIEESIKGLALQIGGGQHKTSCPVCGPKRKKKNQRTLSIIVEDERAMYQCWHCQTRGHVFLKEVYTKQIQRVAPMTAVKNIKTSPLSDNALRWLSDRGISKQTAEKLGLTSANYFVGSIGKETDCVFFPYKNKGITYASKIRSVEGKGFSCNGAPQSFFNLDNVVSDDWLIICEGEMDVLALVEAGYESAISVPNGAVMKVVDGKVDPESDGKFRFIWDAKEKLDRAERIVICTDADDPGQAMGEEIARRIGKDRCWKVTFPEGCKDANDVLLKHGEEGVDKLISECKPWPVAGLYDAKHFYDQLDKIYEDGISRGESTGYDNVDDYYTIVAGQLSVVTGHPSSGKSEFIDQIMINMAQEKGWRFGICSFENEPRIHIAKLISKYIKKPFFSGVQQRMNQHELEAGKKFVQSHFSFLYQADGSLSSIDSIIDRLKIAVMRHGIRGAVIDPYNYIQRPRDVSETEWVSDMLTKLRVFAQAHDIHLWFVAHPTKMMRDASGTVPAPKGYDISGSAAWFAKADCGVTVHRPDPVGSMISEVHVWKVRFSWVGKQGVAELEFDTVTSTYRKPVHDEFLSKTYTPYKDDDDDIPF